MAPPEEGTFPANLSQADPRTARKLEERPTDPKSSFPGTNRAHQEPRRSHVTIFPSSQTSRRKFLRGAAVVSAATVTAPTVVSAQGPITMRWQSTWPSKDIFHEYALDYAKKVNDMTGGDLKIDVLPAGAVVPAFGLLDAVSKGTLDGGHGVLVYHYGKQNALALWGSGPGYGWTPTCCWPGTNTGAARSCSTTLCSSAPTSFRSPMGRCTRSRLAGIRSRSRGPKISRA